LWVDGEIGNPNDDLEGMDVAGNGFYFYNGDDNDGGFLGYGLNPPAQGVYMLKGPKADAFDGIDNNRNGIIDEQDEEIYFSSFCSYSKGQLVIGRPEMAIHFNNYSNAKWKDGTDVVYGGTGYPGSLGSTNLPAKFMFPAHSDTSIGWGLGGTSQNPVASPFIWSTGFYTSPFYTRSSVAGIGDFTFQPGAVIDLTYAFIYSRGTNGAMSSVDKLLNQDAPQIRQWYAQGNFPSCLDLSTVNVGEVKKAALQVKMYPNPVQNELNIEVPAGELAQMEIYDVSGKRAMHSQLEAGRTHQINVSHLSSGQYLVRMQQGNQQTTKKLVKHD